MQFNSKVYSQASQQLKIAKLAVNCYSYTREGIQPTAVLVQSAAKRTHLFLVQQFQTSQYYRHYSQFSWPNSHCHNCIEYTHKTIIASKSRVPNTPQDQERGTYPSPEMYCGQGDDDWSWAQEGQSWELMGARGAVTELLGARERAVTEIQLVQERQLQS